jgi:hypothetical protein
MIVRKHDGSLLLITQPDHAALSGRIMETWTGLDVAERRDSILRAVSGHDTGWREPDSAPMVDPSSGHILDFVVAPLAVRQGVWPRGVASVADDPWAAALIAQHAVTVYDRYRGDPAWNTFFDDMAAMRDAHRQRTSLDHETLLREYAFVRLGDLASLVFCNQWSDEQRFGGFVMRIDGSGLVVSPDPFDGRTVAFEIGAREMPDRTYSSDADARAAFESAAWTTLEGTIRGRA